MPVIFTFFNTRAYTLGVRHIPNKTDSDVTCSRACDQGKITKKAWKIYRDGCPPSQSHTFFAMLNQGCQIYFFKKGQIFSKKGQKRPTKLLKKAKHPIKKGQKKPNPLLDKAKFIKICLLTTQIKIHFMYSQHLYKKELIQTYFLEFLTYDRKMPKFFSFLKTPK